MYDLIMEGMLLQHMLQHEKVQGGIDVQAEKEVEAEEQNLRC
jgi:hypothetical protein